MTTPDFDQIIERRGTNCNKWDDMQAIYGVPADEGLAMWVADMDFRPPAPVQAAVEKLAAHGIYGYSLGAPRLSAQHPVVDGSPSRLAGRSRLDPDHAGLVNGTALAVQAFTRPGDRVILMTPVYHAFARVIRAQGREVAEFPLARDNTAMSWTGTPGAAVDWARRRC